LSEVHLLDHLALVERIISSECRGRGMTSEDTEEFRAEVMLQLIQRDYAILRKFQGRSSFGTFITTVISRLINDYRDKQWGKWRGSAAAKRLGRIAIELERMLYRDGRTLDEATSLLAGNHPELSRIQLEQLAARLPQRVRPRHVPLDHATNLSVDETLFVERESTARQISDIVNGVVSRLPAEDRLVLQLHFTDEMPVPVIARSLALDVQALYRRLRRILEHVREQLETAGIRSADIEGIIESNAQLDFDLRGEQSTAASLETNHEDTS
jgi:RNA polymerase sigma factor (sigma-70 family)